MFKLRLSAILALFFGLTMSAFAVENCTDSGTASTLTGGVCNNGPNQTGSICTPTSYTGGSACQTGLPPNIANDAACSQGQVYPPIYVSSNPGDSCKNPLPGTGTAGDATCSPSHQTESTSVNATLVTKCQ
jgi:hypothetical protein